MTSAQWQDANTRYMTCAVAWVRALLRERVKASSVVPPTGSQPSSPSPRSFWRSMGQTLATVEAKPLAISSAEGSGAAEAAMNAAAEEMTPPPQLLMLAQRLRLSEFERNVLLLCAATELDTSMATLCASAQEDAGRPYPTFALALSLFADPAWEALSPERPLRYWRLIEIGQSAAVPLTASPLRADERIVNLLKGLTYLDDRLNGLLAELTAPGADIPNSQRVVAESLVDQLRAVPPGEVPAVQLLGIDGPSKQLVASLVCQSLALQAYGLDWRLLPGSSAELEAFARLWQRESMLLAVVLYLDVDGSEGAPGSGIDLLLTRLSGGLVFLATRHLRQVSYHTPIAAEIRKPTNVEQRDCWARALGDAADGVPEALAAQFDLNSATIADLARRITVTQATDAPTLCDRLWEACRRLTRPRLDVLAHRIDARVGWNDLVLPDAELSLLRQIAAQVGHRNTVYETWGFARRMSRGLGISVLFAGATGTGKSMAAEVIANELRLDIFRIDLSAVMSKYIGETEANLRRLFDAAEDGGAILFFDEADALFGKRTEVKDSHDRYANIEINYLLQRMESYGGLAILATNMKSSLDQAFLRRLRFVIDFPFPGVAQRTMLWRKAFPASMPTQGIDAERLARLNLTGGHITVIALNAAFAAARAGTPVTMPIVLDAARAEFRKLGRAVTESDFRWQPVAVA